ncbi:MAG: energy transducer TonB [Bacteroidota bacterium]|nr:energy transducer TonB [Bacteroidota bacterium]
MKKTLIIILSITFFSSFSYSSPLSNVLIANNDSVYEQVDVFPEFVGGMETMTCYIQERMVYPQEAIANKETARVFVEFVVDKSGSVKDVQLKRQEKKYFDDEAIRVVSEMPKWKAGLLNGKYVNTRLVLPIIFKL